MVNGVIVSENEKKVYHSTVHPTARMIFSKKVTRSIYAMISILIMIIYIMRRRAGHETEIASGEMTELQVFLVSGLLDGLVAIVLFSVLFWTTVVALRKRVKHLAESNGQTIPDLFR